MARHWERFTAGPTITSRDRMHVTINHRGVIMLNRKAYESLGSPKAAALYFEKATSVIGINSAHARLREAFPVKPKGAGGYWTINAIPFCRHFGIETAKTEAFTDPEIDDKGVLELDLRRTRVIFGGFRRKNKQRREAELAAVRKAA
jgi:hypothetical protein